MSEKHFRYTPQNIDLDTKLRPFIPEFIPAVGDIDAFIKVIIIYQFEFILSCNFYFALSR